MDRFGHSSQVLPKEYLPENIPLVIGPISISNAALRRHSFVYVSASNVAERFRIPYIYTLRSLLTIEEFNGRKVSPTTEHWLEVFPFVDVYILRSLVMRAENCGFSAIVLSFMDPFNSVASLFDEHATEQPRFWLPGLQPTSDDAIYQFNDTHPPNAKGETVASFIQLLRSFTKNSIVAYLSVMQKDLIFQALHAGVDAVCVVIDEYTPFRRFVEVIQIVNQSTFKNIPIYAGGSSFTETEVVELISHGVARVMIDQPILWGFMIDGFDGISNVINIYMKKLFNLN